MAKRSRIGPFAAWMILLGAVLGSAAVIAGGTWLMRQQIVARVAEDQLAALGLPDASLKVVAVETDRLVLADLRSDPEGAATVERVEVTFALDDLSAGRVDRVRLVNPHIVVSDGPDGLDFGALQPLIGDAGGEESEPAGSTPGSRPKTGGIILPLTAIDLEGARITYRTAEGDTELVADGTVRGGRELFAELAARLQAPAGDLVFGVSVTESPPGRFGGEITVTEGRFAASGLQLGGLSGKLSFSGMPGPTEHTKLNGRITAKSAMLDRFPFEPFVVDLDAGQDDAMLTVTASDATSENRLTASLHVAAPLSDPTYRLDLDGTLADTSALADRFAEDRPREDDGAGDSDLSGSGRVFAQLRGRLPPLPDLGDSDPLSLLRMARGGGFDVNLTGLDLPGIGNGLGLTGSLELDVDSDGYGVSLKAPAPLRLTAARLAPGLIERFDLPPTLAVLLTEGGADDPPLSVTLDGPGQLDTGATDPPAPIAFGLRVRDAGDAAGARQRAEVDAALAIALRDRIAARLAMTARASRSTSDSSAGAYAVEVPAFLATASGSPTERLTGIDVALTGKASMRNGSAFAEVDLTAGADRLEEPEAGIALAAPRLALRHAIAWTESGLVAEPTAPLLAKAERLTLPDLQIDGLDASLSVALQQSADSIVLHLRNTGSIAAAAVRTKDGPRTESPVALTLDPTTGSDPGGARPLLTMDVDGLAGAAVRLALDPLTVRLPGETGTLRIALPDGVAAIDPASGGTPAARTLAVALRDATLDLPVQRLGLSGISLDLETDVPTDGTMPLPRIKLTASEVRDHADPAAFTPVSASLDVAPLAGDQSGRKAELIAAVVAQNGAFAITAVGEHDLASGRGKASLSMDEVMLGRTGLPLADLSPLVGREIQDISGGIDLGGSVSWDGTDIVSDIGLVLKDLNVTYSGITITRLNTAVQIDRLAPLRTRPNQQIAVAAIDVGLPLTDAVIPFRLTDGTLLTLGETRFKLAGGEVRSESLAFNVDDLDGEFVLQVEGVDVAQLLSITELDGLVATGRLKGAIPVRLKDGSVAVLDGKLTADSGGTFAYRPDEPPPGLAGGGESVNLMLKALSNFQYKTLEVDLTRGTDGETAIKLHLAGSNPDFYDGYPVVFNLNLSGKLDQIVRRSLRDYGAPATIRRLQEQYGKD